MRLLADESFPGPAVDALRERGHDVLWARTACPGSKDDALLRLAQQEQRVVLTLDKDFGELAFRSGLPAACGVVLFRLLLPSPEAAARRIVAVLEERGDWTGIFVVVEEGRSRIRPLPGNPG